MVLKVLNCGIGFQDLVKVLNLAKMYMKYTVWKFQIQPLVYSNFVFLPLMTAFQMFFALCSMNTTLKK